MPEVKRKLKNGPGARPGCPDRYLQDGHQRLLGRRAPEGEGGTLTKRKKKEGNQRSGRGVGVEMGWGLGDRNSFSFMKRVNRVSSSGSPASDLVAMTI